MDNTIKRKHSHHFYHFMELIKIALYFNDIKIALVYVKRNR